MNNAVRKPTPHIAPMKQALEALGEAMSYMEAPTQVQPYVQTSCAITALRTAIEQMERAEPFGWYHTTAQGEVKFTTKKPSWGETVWPPLYLHPAQDAADAATCVWSCEDNLDMPDTWDGACGAKWSFIDGGPTENNLRFCPECGKRVEVAMKKEHSDET